MFEGPPTTGAPPGTHPVEACARLLAETVNDAAELEATFMTTDAKARVITKLHAVENQVKALRLKVMAASSDVASENAAADVASWLAHEVNADLRDARADQRLAKALDDRFPVVAAAFADGRVSEEQAWVIVRAVDALPKRVGLQVKADAEETLVDCAAQFAPTQLRILGRHILHVVAPEIADEEDAKKLAEEEATAEERSRLSIRDLGDGTSRISGIIPTPAAKRLDTYLDALTSPRHRGPDTVEDETQTTETGDAEPLEPTTTELPDGTEIIGCHDEGDRIPYPKKRALAFCTLLERLDPDRLPEHGGDATTVLVTITLEDLRSELGVAGLVEPDLEHGPNITAAEARRLACNAGIIPVVLGSDSEVLDLGRTRRLHTPHQRKAIRRRDKRCRARGCRVKPQWCEIHHLHAWRDGGSTSIDDGVCLCAYHHRLIENPNYEHRRLPDGDLFITKRRS
ncbi:HNH endonuclease signature motif containing protein [Nocardioides sp. TF02-7]|uniref:HNH endonuclease signature motif containing protein n=1 Tax=Nocardioides sp. TF02-7 TaxID=2917724 RepID=UPI001F06C85E|nr:HNH endonuclease signature motif containing protein [Nocardioides sp. TF02-7]UMG91403.1 HNH endonuclease [Nocardioides sp. TF02-7]